MIEITRLKGKVIRFNGTFGTVYGEDSQSYFFHKSNIDTSIHSPNNARKQLSNSTPDKPVEIEFTPQPMENKNKKPIAADIRIIKAHKWQPQYTVTGFWLQEQQDLTTIFRCSSCGTTNDYKTKFCPHCGAPMIGKSNTDGFSRQQLDVRHKMHVHLGQTKTITMAIETLEMCLNTYLKYIFTNSKNLICHIGNTNSFSKSVHYQVTIENINTKDKNIVKKWINKSIYKNDQELSTIDSNTFAPIVFPKDISELFIRESCLSSEYSIDKNTSTNETITFIGETQLAILQRRPNS